MHRLLMPAGPLALQPTLDLVGPDQDPLGHGVVEGDPVPGPGLDRLQVGEVVELRPREVQQALESRLAGIPSLAERRAPEQGVVGEGAVDQLEAFLGMEAPEVGLAGEGAALELGPAVELGVPESDRVSECPLHDHELTPGPDLVAFPGAVDGEVPEGPLDDRRALEAERLAEPGPVAEGRPDQLAGFEDDVFLEVGVA